MLHFVYTGDPEIGQQKFERFKKLEPIMEQTTVIRKSTFLPLFVIVRIDVIPNVLSAYIQLNHLNVCQILFHTT
jgi:hypothetical protein